MRRGRDTHIFQDLRIGTFLINGGGGGERLIEVKEDVEKEERKEVM